MLNLKLQIGILFVLLFLPTLSFAQDTVVSQMPEFSYKRGFYSEPFYLTITAMPVNSTIRITTDCSKPDRDTGTIYTEPILISKMTTIRAVAYEDTTLTSEVRTHSFVFPADVLTQDDSDVPQELLAKIMFSGRKSSI